MAQEKILTQIQAREKRLHYLTVPEKKCCSTMRMLKQLERLTGLLKVRFLTLQIVFAQPDLL
ncbi:hypothetical protein D3C76_1191980 [compost metagenome]